MGPGVVFIHPQGIEAYRYPAECPFKTERAGMTEDILRSMGLLSGDHRRVCEPRPASRAELERFHTAPYLDALQRAQQGHLDADALFLGLGTEDCPVFKGMYEYATLACGGTLAGARLVLSGEAHVAFNPSGGFHHAAPAKAGGFCYVNDIVIACLELAAAGKRVFCLDLDVHHGDGVQDAFYERSDVMTVSMHESGRTLFPGGGFPDEIGVGEGRGYNVNIGLPVGTYDEPYLRAFRELVVPLLEAYAPDAVTLEVGMDGLSGDPLAHLSLTNNAYADAVSMVMAAGRPVLITGGGGYNPQKTARGWALVWRVACGEDDPGGMDLALGGVMLESTDWHGGLRDRALVPDHEQVARVNPAIDAVIASTKAKVFPLHGL